MIEGIFQGSKVGIGYAVLAALKERLDIYFCHMPLFFAVVRFVLRRHIRIVARTRA